MNLEIGGGTMCPPDWLNLDPVHGTPVNSPLLDGLRPVGPDGEAMPVNLCCYAQEGIPLADETVDHVKASHVMEHIPAGQPRIDTMNEVWRVLKPGGSFLIIVPVIGCTYSDGDFGEKHVVTPNWRPWADPTHVSYWWWPASFEYFLEDGLAANADYGIKLWQANPKWEVGGDPWWEGKVWLVKP